METECSKDAARAKAILGGVGRRTLEADFSAGRVSSDGGVLLLRAADERSRVLERLASCFTDHRQPERTVHSVTELLRQRIYGLALGYEDLNDHEELSRDPLIATAIGKEDPLGEARTRQMDKGVACASASTLGRLERTKEDATSSSRTAKIVCNFAALQTMFTQLFIERFDEPPSQLVLDLDPSDIRLHGKQEQRFFHGYYDHYCYLPNYVFCGDYPLAVRLRPSNVDGSAGSLELIEPTIHQLRAAFPHVQLILRGDSGFCRDELMTWCESHGVDYVFGIAKNTRLEALIASAMGKARREYERTGRPARRYRTFPYRTLKSWSRSRRVVGKAEYLSKGENPRFVVTSLSRRQFPQKLLYEQLYCARGEMENRIKEQQLGLFGTRTSAHRFRPNRVRVWLSMMAHLLIVLVRNEGLVGTEFARAQAPTLRARLFKIGALITVSVRRVYVRLSSAFPRKALFMRAIERLRAAPA
ncbi:MAG: IS1380 family transposase [Myxococcota bacterium]